MRYSQVVIDMHDSKKHTKVSNTDVLEQYINSLVSEDSSEFIETVDTQISQLKSESIKPSEDVITNKSDIDSLENTDVAIDEIELVEQVEAKAIEPVVDVIPEDMVTVFQVCGVKFGIKSNEILSIESSSAMDVPANDKESVKARINNRDILVLNTSKIVLPNKVVSACKNVILLKDKAIGLTCDNVDGDCLVDESDIRRSSQNTQRKWLAGTVNKLKLALLDTDRLIEACSYTE